MPSGADLILATDPDCDRMGCAAPISTKRKNALGHASPGNQLSALLTDYVCASRKKAGTLTNEHFLVTTLVTTPLVRRIGDELRHANARQRACRLQVDRPADRCRAEPTSSCSARKSRTVS